MARAVEMLSGDRKRLPSLPRTLPYRSKAKALLPFTTSARSAAGTSGPSADAPAVAATPPVLLVVVPGWVGVHPHPAARSSSAAAPTQRFMSMPPEHRFLPDEGGRDRDWNSCPGLSRRRPAWDTRHSNSQGLTGARWGEP